ncbi:MAG: acetyl-CoA carboxylase, carboxyltransferase subunit beta [Ktedonobacterales bacterium]
MKQESKPALPRLGRNGAHPESAIKSLPGNLLAKCPNCKDLLVAKDLDKNQRVCTRCGYHFKLDARERLDQLLDPDSFTELAAELRPGDPLSFVSEKGRYADELENKRHQTGLAEAVVIGRGTIEELPLVLAVMDFRFIGGSMGSVVGEKIAIATERAAAEGVPLLIVSASGGARMQEGLFALMQMAKTSAALSRLAEAGVPFISLLTDPTTGGVLASFAMLGDVMLAEPGAVIGFAGPRVVEQAMHQRLPKDTNTAEFVLQHGMIDAIVPRRELRATLARILRFYAAVPHLDR